MSAKEICLFVITAWIQIDIINIITDEMSEWNVDFSFI